MLVAGRVQPAVGDTLKLGENEFEHSVGDPDEFPKVGDIW